MFLKSCFLKEQYHAADFGKINKSHVEGRSNFILHGEGGAGRSEKGVGIKQQQKIQMHWTTEYTARPS
jgi:hypothetical protein